MKYVFFIFFLISLSFSSIDGIIKLQSDGYDTLSGNVSFYVQYELPSYLDPNARDSLGVSHVYIVLWNQPNNYHFKTDMLVGNVALTKEKLENKIMELGSITDVNLELLNGEEFKNWKIQSLIFE
jgi:hypothetical protein